MRELKARQTVMVTLFGADVALTFANSTIFFAFPFPSCVGFFSILLSLAAFLLSNVDGKKFIENPLKRQSHKQSKSLILMGHTHPHKHTRTHLYNVAGVYRPKVKHVCQFAKWKWNAFMRRHGCESER